MNIIPFERSYLIVLCLCLICLYLPLYTLLLALTWATILSHCIQIVVTGLNQIGMSLKKFFSHSASSTALSSAMNFDYIVDHAIHDYLEDFHKTVASLNVKTYPLVNFVYELSKIQLASL